MMAKHIYFMESGDEADEYNWSHKVDAVGTNSG